MCHKRQHTARKDSSWSHFLRREKNIASKMDLITCGEKFRDSNNVILLSLPTVDKARNY